MDFNSSVPIYLQLMNDIKLQIVSGQLQPGEKLASVRDLAMHYEVNPNTMQKALSELERENLVFSQRTSGRFVTIETDRIQSLRQKMANEHLDALVKALSSMGYSNDESIELIKTFLEGKANLNTTT